MCPSALDLLLTGGVLCDTEYFVEMRTIAVAQIADMKALEKETFRKFHSDGLLDVFLGVMLALMPLDVGKWFDSEAGGIATLLGVYGALVTGFVLLRRHLLRTRLGEFKPGPRRRRKVSTVRIVLIGSAMLGFVAWAVATTGSIDDVSFGDPDFFIPLLWMANAVIVFSAMAHFLDVPRFHAYGPLFGLVFVLRVWPRILWDIELSSWVAFGVPAAVIVAVGLAKLKRFIRDYPLVDQQEPGLGL